MSRDVSFSLYPVREETDMERAESVETTVVAPPGDLRISLVDDPANGGTVVSRVGLASVLAGLIDPGERIVAVNGTDVSAMNRAGISEVMTSMRDRERVLTLHSGGSISTRASSNPEGMLVHGPAVGVGGGAAATSAAVGQSGGARRGDRTCGLRRRDFLIGLVLLLLLLVGTLGGLAAAGFFVGGSGDDTESTIPGVVVEADRETTRALTPAPTNAPPLRRHRSQRDGVSVAGSNERPPLRCHRSQRRPLPLNNWIWMRLSRTDPPR